MTLNGGPYAFRFDLLCAQLSQSPLPVKVCVPLIASLLVAGAPGTQAQSSSYYAPTYTGGTYAADPPPVSGSDSQNYMGYASTAVAYYGAGGGTAGSAHCSGSITATLTWTGSDPTPPALIVAEDAQVDWEGGTHYDSFDCGLPNPEFSTGTNGGSQWATRYTGYSDPGGSVTLPSVSPTVAASLAASDPYEQNLMAGVTYRVTPYPITIQLTGTTKDSSGGENILIGQHCGASLTGIPSACTVSYQWSVSGPTFQYWSSDTPTPYNPDASYYIDGPGDLTAASPGWYWHDIGNGSSKPETVSCTATVTPPAGQGSAFTVTATKQVIVWVPNWTCTGTGGTMQVNTTAPSSSGGDYWLWAGPISGSGAVGGMDWEATVSTPAPTLFGDGSVIMVQLIIPDLTYTALNMFGLNSTYTWSLNGQEGLDTDYPYPWTEQPPSYSFYFSNDNPGLNLTATGALSGYVADQFEDYLMYFAPGSVQCVPLAHFVWNTDGNATIPSPGGWPAFSGSAGSITPSNSATSFLRNNSFPMWTQNSGNNPPSSGHF